MPDLQQALLGRWDRVGIEGSLLGRAISRALPNLLEFFPGGAFSGPSVVVGILSGGSYSFVSDDTIRVDSGGSTTHFKLTISGDQLVLAPIGKKYIFKYRRAGG